MQPERPARSQSHPRLRFQLTILRSRTRSLNDLHYILNRWGDRWASDREEARQAREKANDAEAVNSMSPGMRMPSRRSKSGRWGNEEEELWDLDLYGAPTFGPGL